MLNHSSVTQEKKPFLVGPYPEISSGILRQRGGYSRTEMGYGTKLFTFPIAEAGRRRDPEAPVVVLKKSKKPLGQLADYSFTHGLTSERRARFRPLPVNRNLTFIQLRQTPNNRTPDSAVVSSHNRSVSGCRETLPLGPCGNGKIPETVKAI